MGFYDWIRENTKHAVLMGVSDAMDSLGDENDGEMNPRLVAALDPAVLPAKSRRKSNKSVGSNAGRKRLGRSLSNVTADSAAATEAGASKAQEAA